MGVSQTPRAIILRALALLGLLALVVLAVDVLVPGAGQRLDAADPLWLAVGVVLEAGALAGCVALFHATFGRAPYGLSLRRSAEIALGELAGFALVPSGAGGPAVRLWALPYWVGDCAVLWAAFQACGGAPAIEVIALAYMLGQLGNLLPLPGGVGGVEPLMFGIFFASGVDPGLAAAAIVCYRAVAFGLQTLTGVASVGSLVPAVRRERRAQAPRVAQAAASPPA